jgi:6-pyruvoyltetrahydropterin/6-carboxytetrahydropterin synthase
MIRASRYHDISCGHRVFGHEGKCAHLHGHNYRIHFHCSGVLDDVGRVIDFSIIKERLAMWVEEKWDHKFLIWDGDPWGPRLRAIDNTIVAVPFNPTAENMAGFLVNVLGPRQLDGTDVVLESVTVEETAKCSASFTL